MTMLLGELVKRSQYKPGMNVEEALKQIDQDLQRLFIALRPSQVATLDDVEPLATDAAIAFKFRITMTADRTLGNPTNPRDGQRIIWEFTQDSVGSHTLALDTKFSLGSEISSVTLSTAPGAIDLLGAEYDSVNDIWKVLSFVTGY